MFEIERVASLLFLLLTLFIPMMFRFSESIIGKIAADHTNKTFRDNVLLFNNSSQFFLQCFALFVVQNIFLISFIKSFNSVHLVYLFVMLLYFCFERFDDKYNPIWITIVILCFFILLPTIFMGLISFKIILESDILAYIVIYCIILFVIWLFLPVVYQPISNLYNYLTS